ncbi:MAG TPA: DNRLRE domain-containing protein [Anaerolineales bacterium]|nr:DNRLRE domain-containing protein [Anaerolineales bacterium]
MDTQTGYRIPKPYFRSFLPTRWIILAIGALLVIGLLVGCSLQNEQEQQQQFSTEVAKQVAFQQTETARSAASSSTPVDARTSVPASLTPTQLQTPISSPVPVPCDQALFVGDITVQDGTVYPPAAHLEKTWRIQNTGSCTWSTDYELVFEQGDQLNGPLAQAMHREVLPGETIDLSISLTTPLQDGYYQGNWKLRNSDGVVFGMNGPSESPLTVAIEVRGSNSAYAYDFAGNVCAATWQSAAGPLQCVSSESSSGFITVLYNPALENGVENEPALWTHPNQANGGWISGTYPEITVENGDHFRGFVGCMADSPACDVIFSLDYQLPGKPAVNLDNWREVYDGQTTLLDINLGLLAGRQVKFILRVNVNNNNPEAANALWLAPRLVYIQPTNTPTLTSTRTSTPTFTKTPSPTPTRTGSPSPTRTSTVTVALTSTPTGTKAPTNTATQTSTITPTSTPGPTDETLSTETPTPNPTETQTATLTATPTNTPTPTVTPSLVPCSLYPRSGILPAKDSWVDRTKPDTTHGKDTLLHIRPSGKVDRRALLRFDLSSIPAGSRITRATLYMNDESGGNYLVEFRRVTSNWDESVTWNTQPSIDTTPIGGFTLTKEPCVRAGQIDPTVVQAWLDSPSTNYGLMLFPPTGGGDASFTSREGSPVPILAVSYSPSVSPTGHRSIEQGAEYVVLFILFNLGLSKLSSLRGKQTK